MFARMFGCNFRCKKFGLPRDFNVGEFKTPNPEVAEVIKDMDKYEKFEDLPLVHTGCDTYASVYPEFKRFATDTTVEEFADHLTNLTPDNKWAYEDGRSIHLIMTGGEPMLGWQRIYPELFENLWHKGLRHITIETNGTQKVNPKFLKWYQDFTGYTTKKIARDYGVYGEYTSRRLYITWSVSPKLSPSGHTWEEAINPEIVASYNEFPYSKLYLKYVVATEEDFEEIEKATKAFRDGGVKIRDVFAMPVGGTVEGLQLTEKQVAELCMKKGYRYSPRLHCNLFGNVWGT